MSTWWKGLSKDKRQKVLKDSGIDVAEPVQMNTETIALTLEHQTFTTAPEDLKELFDKLNHEYFGGSLKTPALRWGNNRTLRTRSITYGYFEKEKYRITMNPILKNPMFPKTIIEYIMYHEMLHIAVPGVWVKKGRKKVFSVHSKEFKTKEKHYRHYRESRNWLKTNLRSILKNFDGA